MRVRVRVRVSDMRELIDAAGGYCDHPAGEHESGRCDYVVVSQEDLTDLLVEELRR